MTNTLTTTIPELKVPESLPLEDATALRDYMGADLVARPTLGVRLQGHKSDNGCLLQDFPVLGLAFGQAYY